MAYPKFLPKEKKSTLGMRINSELLDSITQYAMLTDTNVTEVVTDCLKEFMEGKIVFNDYLDVGKTINIPLSELGRKEYLKKQLNLSGLKENDTFEYGGELKEIPIKTIEIKKIPNNLDVFRNDSFKSEDSNFLHEGIEFYVVDDYVIPNDTTTVPDMFYLNNLYCLYFLMDWEENVFIYLIDYLDAINSLEGKDGATKDRLIACISELKEISRILKYESDKLEEIPDEERKEKKAQKVVDRIKSKLIKIANTYNSGNIVPFGEDIEKRLILNEMKTEEILDKKIEKLEELNKTLEKHEELILQELFNKIINEPINENTVNKDTLIHYKKELNKMEKNKK